VLGTIAIDAVPACTEGARLCQSIERNAQSTSAQRHVVLARRMLSRDEALGVVRARLSRWWNRLFMGLLPFRRSCVCRSPSNVVDLSRYRANVMATCSVKIGSLMRRLHGPAFRALW
jgi:hypothetical protein